MNENAKKNERNRHKKSPPASGPAGKGGGGRVYFTNL